ncbi:MAG: hypothetical protein LLG09_01350 [Negativicutes bacterium]|nr:hypothetical protein [Negativicutes bacterium]
MLQHISPKQTSLLLAQLTDAYPIVSIIGLSKNAGKTTVLNSLLQGLSSSAAHPCIGLTSIGLDGESHDLLSQTLKPEIYVLKGSLFATAADLLPLCDITKQIEQVTEIATPLGRIVLVRARSDGYIQLAGPSIRKQLWQIQQELKQLGAERILVDGAMGRRVFTEEASGDGVILCSGAAFHQSMAETIGETLRITQLFSLPLTELPSAALEGSQYLICQKDGSRQYISASLARSSEFSLPVYLQRDSTAFYTAGAVTDLLLRQLLHSGIRLQDFTLIVNNGSCILAQDCLLRQFLAAGAGIRVRQQIPILAITANAYAFDYPVYRAEQFIQELAEAIHLPIIDVKEGIVCNLAKSHPAIRRI